MSKVKSERRWVCKRWIGEGKLLSCLIKVILIIWIMSILSLLVQYILC